MSPRSRRRGTRGAWVAVALVAGLGAAGAVVVLGAREHPADATDASAEPVTAAVELATLTSEVRLNGRLTYGEAVPLPPAGGTVTALPTAGSVVRTGEQVYEADGRPVVLLRGERPFWRELSTASDDGEDVRQLQENLADLGFYDGAADGDFGPLTRLAVREWQRSLGLPRTGVVSPGAVVVADAPGIRIAEVTAHLGDTGVSPATVTETTLRATARLTAAQARELSVGAPVTVTLPDGTAIDTTLAGIDPGGQPTGEGDATTSPTATMELPDQDAVAAHGPAAVRVALRDDEAQTPALVLPVTALLATADGGYAVEVLVGGEVVRTPVEVGRVADARAQVLASGSEVEGGQGPVLAEGDRVVLAR